MALALTSPRTRLSLVHVVPPPHEVVVQRCSQTSFVSDDALRAVTARLVKRADRQFDLIRSSCGEGVALETRTLIGHPAHTICDLCEREKFDLIIITSHGSTGIGKMQMGSVTEAIIGCVPIPVLVIKPQMNASGELSPRSLAMRRVLVGYDTRPGGGRALEVAGAIVAPTDASLTILRALRPMDAPNAPSQADLAETARELKLLCESKKSAGRSWKTHVAIGLPCEVIAATAKAQGTDLIVLGPHEHTRWGHSFGGSTAARVVALAPCAVLALR